MSQKKKNGWYSEKKQWKRLFAQNKKKNKNKRNRQKHFNIFLSAYRPNKTER